MQQNFLCPICWKENTADSTVCRYCHTQLGLLGAVSFGASDTLIAFDRFAAPIPGVRWPIMILYWLGQSGIAASAQDPRR